MIVRLLATAMLAAIIPARATAQTVESIATPPPNIIVPNYKGVPTGPLGSLEGCA